LFAVLAILSGAATQIHNAHDAQEIAAPWDFDPFEVGYWSDSALWRRPPHDRFDLVTGLSRMTSWCLREAAVSDRSKTVALFDHLVSAAEQREWAPLFWRFLGSRDRAAGVALSPLS
jgi:hypothetical protein